MNRSFPIALLLGGALFSIQPADACHRFARWAYPTPQRCGVEHARQAPQKPAEARPDHSWYVEMVTKPDAPAAPLEADQRTPAEIKDFDEHYEQVEKHKAEINFQMDLIRRSEGW